VKVQFTTHQEWDVPLPVKRTQRVIVGGAWVRWRSAGKGSCGFAYSRAIRAALLARALVSLLAGCSSLRSAEGRTVTEASRAVATHNGVKDGHVAVRNYKSGFTSRWGVDVHFSPSKDTDLAEDASLLRDLLRIGWSVSDHRIDGGVTLVLDDTPGVDLADVARNADIPPFENNEALPEELTVPSREMRRSFGKWSGGRSW
jgi:hypothetical protein